MELFLGLLTFIIFIWWFVNAVMTDIRNLKNEIDELRNEINELKGEDETPVEFKASRRKPAD